MQLSGAGPSFLHVKSGEFNKGVNPTVVPKCCIWRRSARPGPCCQRFSETFAVTRTASAKNRRLACSDPLAASFQKAQSSVATFHVTFPGVQLRDLRPGDTNYGNTRIKVLARQRRNQPKSQQRSEIQILSRKGGITLLQAADESGLVAALSLSRLEPPSRSNLPKDPPSKTATLHKKDDTDTRIIFKSCGTACSLLRFQRLTANFLLCLPALRNTNLDNNRTQTRFYPSPDHVAQ